MASGSKKGTQIYFSFLSKVPTKEPPPGWLFNKYFHEIVLDVTGDFIDSVFIYENRTQPLYCDRQYG